MKFTYHNILKAIAVSSLICLPIANGFAGNGACSNDPAVSCSTKSQSSLETRKNKVAEIYKGLIYPNPKAVLADHSIVNHIFEESVVKGRVNPAGAYGDFEAAIEYFYALAYTGASMVDSVEVLSLVASGDKVAVEVDIHFCNAPYNACNPAVKVDASNTTLRQTGFYTFNANDKVISFDLTIPNLGKAHNRQTDAQRMQDIINVCAVLTTAHYNVINEQVVYQGTCPTYFDGPEDFPAGFPAVQGQPMLNCISHMMSIPYGTWDQPESNTVVCRMLHSLITPIRPEVHCPHVSYFGGGECVDKPYSHFFEAEF